MTTIAIVCFLTTAAAVTAQQVATSTADAALERGIASFRAGNHQSAVEDLQIAAQGFLTPDQMRSYVDTGKLETLPRLETALVYLAIAQSRLGRTDDARNTVLRLITAERIEPTYSALVLDSDAREFETLASTLVPSAPLQANASFGTPLPPVRIAETPTPTPATTITEDRTTTATEAIVADTTTTPAAATAEAPLAPVVIIERPAETTPVQTAESAPAQATETTPAPDPTQITERPAPPTLPNGQALIVQPTIAQERAERQRIIDELVARERVKIQREADERVAAVERTAGERVASAERAAQEQIAAAERAAQEQVAAANRAAQEQIAAAERAAQERLVAEQRATAERLEAERASIQRAADERVAAERATAARLAAQQLASQTTERRNTFLTTLRQADAFAANERLSEANELYNRVASSPDVPREFLASAAIGLYRTGAFRDAVKAFGRLAPYQRGEEDLRYYHAVALYETGNYSAAQKELACAVPFIQVTEDVSRYREKIERTVAQASR